MSAYHVSGLYEQVCHFWKTEVRPGPGGLALCPVSPFSLSGASPSNTSFVGSTDPQFQILFDCRHWQKYESLPCLSWEYLPPVYQEGGQARPGQRSFPMIPPIQWYVRLPTRLVHRSQPAKVSLECSEKRKAKGNSKREAQPKQCLA